MVYLGVHVVCLSTFRAIALNIVISNEAFNRGGHSHTPVMPIFLLLTGQVDPDKRCSHRTTCF